MKEFFIQCVLFKSKDGFNRCLGVFVWINFLQFCTGVFSIYLKLKS